MTAINQAKRSLQVVCILLNVTVTVQYRLGSMGFLSSGDKHQPGNQGMLDQVEALRWVKKNIINWKGDPEKVVIFGESAGAVAVTLHLLSPLTKGMSSNFF